MHWLDAKINNGSLVISNQKVRSLIIITTVLFTLSGHLSAKEKLSENAKISVLTCGPGQPLYAAFGHSALRVSDAGSNIDEVFNYGTFDFNTPNFYLRFLSGKLDYVLDVSDYDDFISEYEAGGRWIVEQEIKLTNKIKQKIYDSLNIARLPQNRAYRYDFFRSNCSTKVFDLILTFTANDALVDSLKIKSNTTFRKALRPYLAGKEWVGVGMNLLLGPFADQPMSKMQQTFLPEGLMNVLNETEIANTSVHISMGGYVPKAKADPDLPSVLLWILLLLLVLEALWFKTSQQTSDLIDSVLFFIPGLMGLLFLALWGWSDHVSLHVNLNLLWANPLNFFLVWAILKRKPKLTKLFAILYSLILFFLLINFGRMPQKFPLEIMPLITALVFRAVNRIFNFKRKDQALQPNPQI